MSNKIEQIKLRYSYEISEIENKLRDLENGRIKEITGANMDGYLATNIIYLRKKLNKLISKIVNESDSVTDELSKFFK